MALKAKKCRVCRERFETNYSNRVVCSIKCSIELVQKNKAKKAAKERSEKRKKLREAKERIKTRSDWMKDAQKAFNAWVRERDHVEPCISCGKFVNNDGLITGSRADAGHYRSVGACPELRFTEENCHLQCVRCNRDLSGNSVAYRIGLIERIGLEKVEWLEGNHPPKKYTIEDLKGICRHYRAEARRLGKLRQEKAA